MQNPFQGSFYEQLLSTIPFDIAVFDDQMRYVYVNRHAVKDDGAREWLTGKTDFDYCKLLNLSSIIADHRTRAYSYVFETGEELEIEELLIDSNSEEKSFIRKFSPLYSNDGKVRFIISCGFEITDRRKFRNELIAYRTFINQVFEAVPHLIFVRNQDGKIIMANRAVEELYLQPGKQNTDRNAFLSEKLGSLTEVEQSVIESGNIIRVEEPKVFPDGRELIFDSIKVPLTVDNDSVRLLNISTDITEKKAAEERIRKSELRLNEAQSLAKMGSFELDMKTMRSEWSKGCYAIWKRDISLGPLPIHEYIESLHPDDRENMRVLLEQLPNAKEKWDVRFRIICPDGELKHLAVANMPEFDEHGNLARVIGSVTDITASFEAEEKLRRSEQRLFEAQELAKTGSWEYDPVTNEVYWSPGTFKLWDRDINLGVPGYEELLLTIDEPERSKISGKNVFIDQNGKPVEIEFRITTFKNIRKTIIIHGKVITDQFTKRAKIIGSVMDITERKVAEDEILRAKQEAESSVRIREYFLANVSHELKTPLNGILGMARLLNKTELSSIQRNYTDVLSSTAGNLLVIINDILDIAKLESGTLTMEQVTFDPVQIADTAIQTQLYKAEEKDLFLKHMNEGEPLPFVKGDPYRLSQVLLNLLSNAIKFTDQGEVVLSHRVIKNTDDKVVIEFSVRDTGIGIAPGMQQVIFESFMQLNNTGTGHYSGTGLGLSISRNLVERQGGRIWVESNEGEGSIFYFEIPYHKADEKPVNPHYSERIDFNRLGSLRILLAEDNRVNQFITEAMLQDWGFRVDVASNGKEAVEFAKREEYDLILMDIQMPELNGVDATRIIRELPDARKARVPVIALTANTSRQAQKRFLAEGMNDYLVKPFKEETLFSKIVAQLETKQDLVASLKRPRFPVRRIPVEHGDQLYNLSMLRKDSRDNPAFISRMLNIFLDTMPSTVLKMQEHFNKGEMDAVCTLAHKIKPTIDGAGIISLRETIRNIEGYRDKKRTRDQLLSDLKQLHDVIDVVSESFRKEIENINEMRNEITDPATS